MKFTKDHEWVSLDGDIATVGISKHAADALGDVVFVEVPEVGKSVAKGPLMGMVASDGPHYGDNVKLDGVGNYKLTFHIAPPPSTGHMAMFGRHVDKETGVAPWFKPFEVQYDFVFAGTGKKGGY